MSRDNPRIPGGGDRDAILGQFQTYRERTQVPGHLQGNGPRDRPRRTASGQKAALASHARRASRRRRRYGDPGLSGGAGPRVDYGRGRPGQFRAAPGPGTLATECRRPQSDSGRYARPVSELSRVGSQSRESGVVRCAGRSPPAPRPCGHRADQLERRIGAQPARRRGLDGPQRFGRTPARHLRVPGRAIGTVCDRGRDDEAG